MATTGGEPPSMDEQARFEVIMSHGHQDLVQAVAFNAYGDRCATGCVDGKIRVFNRHQDGVWRLCDSWGAHGAEILEIQWLPPTIYPNLLGSLGIEGRFKLWTEDPTAAPGHRFMRPKGTAKAAYEARSARSSYRSFSLKHDDATRHTYLALLAADGTLTVLENDQPENLADYTSVDEFRVCPRPARGEEASFRVRFDPNPDPCYTALRAGLRPDALSLVVAAMDTVKIYRTRPITTTSYGLQGTARAFYLAAEVKGHRGLVRDVAWAPGNFRGYDIVASACQDGYVRVVRIDTPFAADDGKSWGVDALKRAAASNNGNSKDDNSSNKNSSSNNNNNSDSNSNSNNGGEQIQSSFSANDPSSSRKKKPAAASAGGIAAQVVAAAAGSGSGGLASAHSTPGHHHHSSAATSTPTSIASSLSSSRDPLGGSGAFGGGGDEESSFVPVVGNDSFTSNNGGGGGTNSVASSTATSFTGTVPTTPEPGADPRGGGGPAGGAGAGPGVNSDRRWTGEPGQVRHTVREMSKLENRRTPVWRVAFDDDGQILGSVGDDGKLLCYRQTPDGSWARSSELTVMKQRMVS